MRGNLYVKIPNKKELSYTLFAQGVKIDIPKEAENSDFFTFKFLGGTAVALFYTFAEFRRAYIVTGWESSKDGEKIFLPGINAPLCLIFKAKGRKIDDLKRFLHWATKNGEFSVFELPLDFWQKLSVLLDCHCKTWDIYHLYQMYMERQDEYNKRAS